MPLPVALELSAGLVNSSDPSWNGEIRKKIFDDAAAVKGGASVINYDNRGEIAGYFPLRGFNGQPVALFELRSSTVWINTANMRRSATISFSSS